MIEIIQAENGKEDSLILQIHNEFFLTDIYSTLPM